MTTRPDAPSDETAAARLPFACDDLSAFAKRLRAQLLTHHGEHSSPPGHLALLNMLARAAGHRNLQAWQAVARRAAAAETVTANEPVSGQALTPRSPQAAPLAPPEAAAAEPAAPALSAAASKALTQFDPWGRLTRWPHKFSVQRLAMWVLWTRFDSGRTYTEREVNDLLKAWTVYGDHVTPRRELVEMGLLARKPDCSAYWKQPQRPAAEVQDLLRAVRARRPAPGPRAAPVHATIGG